MSSTAIRGRLGRALALALGLLALQAPAAGADTVFGADPTEPLNTPLNCGFGAPYPGFGGLEPAIGTAGSPSCMWTWNNPAVGSDIVPFPVTGGTGTITSVTLPAMPNPGPMAVVVLTAALNETTNPARPNSICCQVKQVGPVFTVPANRVTAVPQALRVSATEAADPTKPGDTSFGDLLGISVLSPTASLPVRYTGNASLANFDGAYAFYPAPPAPSGEFTIPYDPAGFRLLARFTLVPDAGVGTGAGGGGEAGAGGGAAGGGEAGGGGGDVGGGGGGGGEAGPGAAAEAAGRGLRLIGRPLRVGGNGRTLTLGRAANPPAVRTVQTLSAPNRRAGRVSAFARGKQGKKGKQGKQGRTVYGRGRTTVPSGRSRALRVGLNRTARRLLGRRGRLRARLTVVATNAAGEKQTVTRTVTVKAPRKQGREKKKGAGRR